MSGQCHCVILQTKFFNQQKSRNQSYNSNLPKLFPHGAERTTRNSLVTAFLRSQDSVTCHVSRGVTQMLCLCIIQYSHTMRASVVSPARLRRGPVPIRVTSHLRGRGMSRLSRGGRPSPGPPHDSNESYSANFLSLRPGPGTHTQQRPHSRPGSELPAAASQRMQMTH